MADKKITDYDLITSGSINPNTALIEIVNFEQLINYKTTPNQFAGSIPGLISAINNSPTSGQKAALVGTNGTPGAGNPYVTDSDPRLTGSTGSLTTATNIGTGEGTIFTSVSGSTLQFKTIKAGNNITVTNNANDITINSIASGSSATGSAVIHKSFTLNEDMVQGDLAVIMSNGNVRKIQYSVFGDSYVYNSADTDLNNVIAVDENKVVIIYRDTVSNNNIAQVGNIDGSSITFGSASIFGNGTNTFISMSALDINKFVLAYRPFGQTSGIAVTGTVSGTSITFGSSSVFATGVASIARILVTALDSSKIVIAYRDPNNSSYGYAITGTVSGTSITFGSSSVIIGEGSYITGLSALSSTSFVVSYRKTASDYEGDLKIGTVSGTSITFGSPVTYDTSTNTIAYFDNIATLNSNKFVINYSDNGNGNKGTSKIGNVSGTSISLGGAVIFTSGVSSGGSNVVPGLPTNAFTDTRFNVITTDGITGALMRIGTVSGTSITFGSSSVFATGAYYFYMDNLNSTSFVIVYTDNTNSNYGTAVYGVGDPNLVTDRISGILQSSGSAGQSKPVAVFGENSSVHTGLIPGRLYYYNITTKNGVIGTSNNNLAGVALSTTELKIVSY